MNELATKNAFDHRILRIGCASYSIGETSAENAESSLTSHSFARGTSSFSNNMLENQTHLLCRQENHSVGSEISVQIRASESQISDHQGTGGVTYPIKFKSSFFFPGSARVFRPGRTFGALGHPLSPQGSNESANTILHFHHTIPP